MTRHPKHDAAYHTTWHPEAEQAIAELKRGNLNFVEPVISFLDKDPYTHGSGYLKEKAWRYLKRVTLTKKEEERLRQIALHCVKTRLGREFFPMCRFICGIADDKLRAQVQKLTESEDISVRRRANLLAAYLESLAHGERYRRQSEQAWVEFQICKRTV
ncbi:MAG: hypothetical protein JO316_06770 [Abitibacteriaceae bacterium]|nr:hypothetical protein [Abditibacteriaceae bacterium]MBV9865035.1 hypothetical protein [Abditibacteriaceae bacterium]